MPPQLLRRGHRRPSEPQAGPAGPPPCPQPPSCHLPLSLQGKEEGLAHIPPHGPLPASGLPKPPSFPRGPWEPPPHSLPTGRGPSGKQGPALPASGDSDKETLRQSAASLPPPRPGGPAGLCPGGAPLHSSRPQRTPGNGQQSERETPGRGLAGQRRAGVPGQWTTSEGHPCPQPAPWGGMGALLDEADGQTFSPGPRAGPE